MDIHTVATMILAALLVGCIVVIINLDHAVEKLENIIEQKNRQITMLNQRMKDLVGKIK